MRHPSLLAALALLACACSDVQPVRLQPGTLSGLVTLKGAAEDGHGGVRIRVSGPHVAVTRTNPDGEWKIEQLAPGDYVVEASADDTLEGTSASVAHVGNLERATAPRLVLTPVGSVRGKATLGGATGNVGIVVMAAGTAASAITEDDGSFLIEHVPVGARDLVAVYPGRQTAVAKAVLVMRGEEAQAPALQLPVPTPPPGVIHGLALLDGQPASAGLLVTAVGPVTAGAVTDAEGNFFVRGVADGTYKLTVVAPSTVEGSLHTEAIVSNGQQAELVPLRFTPLGALTGTVTLTGSQSFAGVQVALPGLSQVALSDEQGRWTLRGVPAGRHTVVFTRAGWDAQSREAEVRWAQTVAVPPLALAQTKAAPGAIAGSAQLSGETNHAGIQVTLAGADLTRTAITDSQGAYLFQGLADGRYTLTAQAPSTLEGLRSVQVTVSGGQVQAPLVRLSPLGRVRGRVLPQGLPAGELAGIRVQLSGTSLAALTEADGSYVIRDVPTGLRDVVASLPGFFTASKPQQRVPYNQTLQVADLVLGDVNECASGNGGCDPNAACQNAPGTRTCSCKTGFTGTGLACFDVDECAVNNGGCSAHATCTNTPGSRTCSCNAGWTGSGTTCSDVDECAVNNGGCDSNATCQNTQGGRTCSCNTGWSGSGTVCVDVDECATNNGGCDRNAACANVPGGRVCSCTTGYAGDGLSCTPGASYLQASMGDEHACGVQQDGTLWCWGRNASGELGLGTSVPKSRPTRVGVSSAWVSVAAGRARTCAVHKEGTLWCWGFNQQRELGDGTNTDRSVPVQIGSATDWASVAAGSEHTCALKGDRTLWCWGTNATGATGTGGTTQPLVPTQVGSASDWTQIAPGESHTCGVRANGTLWCWGRNASGQLGTGNTTPALTPVQVGTASDWAQVAVGDLHTCARKTTGTLWCWGDNAQGQLGSTPGAAVTSPVRVGGASTWAALAAGSQHACATTTSGQLWCWGSNANGQLGDGTLTSRSAPTRVGSASTWAQVLAREQSTCAIGTDGRLACWGLNGWGQLGGGESASKVVPTQIGTGSRWAQVRLTHDALCARQLDNSLWCTGAADALYGGRRLAPQGQQTAWSSFDAGSTGGCATRLDGTLWCWGTNTQGQVGDGTQSPRTSEVQVAGGPWTQVSQQSQHTCAVRADRTLWCWGANNTGQLGSAVGPRSLLPVQVGADADWTQVTTSQVISCAVKGDGTLWCWGYNTRGQLGDGTTVAKSAPTAIGTDAPWRAVSAGELYTCGIRQAGSLWCWGDNSRGQLGSGDLNRTLTPVQVGTASSWVHVAAGATHTCARRSDGSLWCWGSNLSGQLGTGSAAPGPVTQPVRVGTDGDWIDVAVADGQGYSSSDGYTCGVRANGTLWCWGDDDGGRMGDASLFVTQPTFVLF